MRSEPLGQAQTQGKYLTSCIANITYIFSKTVTKKYRNGFIEGYIFCMKDMDSVNPGNLAKLMFFGPVFSQEQKI